MKLAKASTLIFSSAEVIQEAFDKLETKNRISYLEPNAKHEHNNQVFPLVSDLNPALPNIGAILTQTYSSLRQRAYKSY